MARVRGRRDVAPNVIKVSGYGWSAGRRADAKARAKASENEALGGASAGAVDPAEIIRGDTGGMGGGCIRDAAESCGSVCCGAWRRALASFVRAREGDRPVAASPPIFLASVRRMATRSQLMRLRTRPSRGKASRRAVAASAPRIEGVSATAIDVLSSDLTIAAVTLLLRLLCAGGEAVVGLAA